MFASTAAAPLHPGDILLAAQLVFKELLNQVWGLPVLISCKGTSHLELMVELLC